jgi:hypothetical protein
VVSAADFSNSVRPLDLGSGQVGAPLEAHSGGYTPDIEVEGGRLVVADRGTFSDPSQAGLLMYDANTDRLIAGPIAVGLPPLSIAALADNPLTAVAEEALALPAATRLGAAYPNPFNAGTLIPLTLDQSTAPLSLVVYDALGRQVRTLAARALPAGLHTLEWDGRDDQGQAVGSGAYVVELRLGAWRQTRKLLLLK